MRYWNFKRGEPAYLGLPIEQWQPSQEDQAILGEYFLKGWVLRGAIIQSDFRLVMFQRSDSPSGLRVNLATGEECVIK